ncbi:MAG: hypothetical protein KJO69_08570 [Gammaproteobacteria bacterium]|nr:hypothetical protein [Gammaproteobacteria bacterium]
MHESWVTIRHYSFIWEAELDRANLESVGIPVELKNAQTLSVQTFLSEPGQGIGLAVPESKQIEADNFLKTDFSNSLDGDA